MSKSSEKLLIHSRTQTLVDKFTAEPSHALLVTGPAGAGKAAVAKGIAADLMNVSAEELRNQPYFLEIEPADSKQEISIDQIRAVNRFISLKVPGQAEIRKLVLIADAQMLSHEAQNALLKLLEEPSIDTLLILTAASPTSLLPTVASRCQKITVQPVDLASALSYYEKTHSISEIRATWNLSQGNAGLLSALLRESETHALKLGVDKAKEFIKASPYDRLLILESLSKNKEELATFVEGMGRVLSALYRIAIGNQKSHDHLLSARRQVVSYKQGLETNANSRLVALSAALNLKV